MKAVNMLLLVCAGFLVGGPAYAHGDETHGGEASAIIGAQDSENTPMAGPGQPTSTSSSEAAQPSTDHDASVRDHESGSNNGGFVSLLEQLHPATVHFPIALFLMAALAELFVMVGRGGSMEPAIRVMIYGGAAGAVLAALFGWIHTGLWFGGDMAMQLHRWNGMLIVVIGIALAAHVRSSRERRTILRAGLFTTATLILFQGYLGGELAHGPNHLGLSWA
ncbi:hypothetical protein A9995_10445 [Erythrobacter sp. QSSC1-22B]|uniref:DUF2231 domain-containing protein n=1 Tax=Erythrobacter sp. QSSC1-22B TaxID=1860125 RepID=UPI00080492F2|nr:DUF2231 domain-containing protein [Erythrobacter sp. QSSC1-22B]OBX18947.1 hypothetical protein A9995_10445 [Erythrobacter sp. QSSC1-22B]